MNSSAEKTKVNQGDLKKVFSEYFELLDEFFSGIKRHLGDGENNHIRLGEQIARHPLIADLVLDAIDDIEEEIVKFWKKHNELVNQRTRNHDGLKCLYSGDLSPVYLDRFTKKAGLYVDTIILPDPLAKLTIAVKPELIDRRFYLSKLVRHVFNVWKMKDIFFANTQYEIVLLSPAVIQMLDQKQQADLVESARRQFLKFFNELLGTEFTHVTEVFDYCESVGSSQDFFAKIRRKDLMPNQLKSPDLFKTKMGGMISVGKKFGTQLATTIPGAFAHYAHSQFIRVKEHLFYCNSFEAEPIYDYDLPWSFLNYELGGQDIDPAILNALQQESFDWIGDVPVEAIIKLREDGELEYIRNELRKGIFSLKSKRDSDLTAVAAQLRENFKHIAAKQKSDLAGLQRKISHILKKEIPIAVGGFLVGFIPAVGNFLSLLPTMEELFSKWQGVKKDVKTEEKSPINLLIQTYERSKQ